MDLSKIYRSSELENDQLIALWYLKNGDWEKAHEVAQSNEGQFDYDRIHAYLHRVEGDLFNAKWWYRQLNMPFPKLSLEEEFDSLVKQYS
ncbi:hypothetical protein [Jiulongibacter sp. NS-SX5]|uniref:hypothetical protein n=1 Tax=Jiulongibacter sp. NS-SX5 TaxID=3463854 RepID=UPI004058F939